MGIIQCGCRNSCNTGALAASAVIGVIAAFLQITGTVTVTAAFLWVVFGIAVAALGVLTIAAALNRRAEQEDCLCATLNTLLAGILGTILLALVLLAIGIIATSLLSAILVGVLLFFFVLMLTSTACLIRCLSGCRS